MKNLKDYVRKSIDRLGKEYGEGLGGRDLVKRYSSMMDACLCEVFLPSLSEEGNERLQGWSIAALGGYGREELSPYSDIDLMFLIPDRLNGEVEDIAGRIFYPLWDAGLTVGHCNRTLKDCLTMMKEDITVRTSLMEMRYLVGDRDLYDHFQKAILKNAFSKRIDSFVSEQLRDMELRHKRFGDSVYLLEPHLKEGEGGLRDIQSALWIAKTRFKARGVKELHEKGVLSLWEISLLEECQEFLWKVRNGLHFASGRQNDHLSFEYQGKIAETLGYGNADSPAVVASFMHDYYQCAENTKYLSSLLIERSKAGKKRTRKLWPKTLLKGMEPCFKIESGGISVVDSSVFKRDPFALMRVFKHSIEFGEEISVLTQELIRNSLDLIDERFRNAAEVSDCFMSILRGKEGVAKVLKTMHRLGFLGSFIPEFGGIVHLPQSPHHHIYTTDIHTLFAIDEFENLLVGNYGETFPFLHNLVKEEKRAELIFMALLLHDLGKAFDADHVEKGVELVHKIADRMGLSSEDTELIAFLVENHIFMSIVAQTRDLYDEDLIIKFSQKMKDLDRLRMLYILTFADLKASRSEAFNSWKATLFQELYIRASHIIDNGNFTLTDTAVKLDKMKNDVISHLRSMMPMEDIQHNLELMPSRYLLNNSPDIISKHILLCYNLRGKALTFDVRKRLEKGCCEVLIATPDSHGLFYKVCGVMVYHNMNILEAQIDTRTDGIAIQFLRVKHVYHDEAADCEEWNAIQNNLEKVIDGRIKVEDLLKKRASHLRCEAMGPKGAKTVLTIDNDTSDFYTVIDVEANDGFGLLYSITKTMSDMGVEIYIAKIATRLMRVTDSFYVRDIFGQKIYNENLLKRIKDDVIRTLDPTGGCDEENRGYYQTFQIG